MWTFYYLYYATTHLWRRLYTILFSFHSVTFYSYFKEMIILLHMSIFTEQKGKNLEYLHTLAKLLKIVWAWYRFNQNIPFRVKLRMHWTNFYLSYNYTGFSNLDVYSEFLSLHIHYLMGIGPITKKIPQNSGKQIWIPEGM